jgi:hypothetical protein
MQLRERGAMMRTIRLVIRSLYPRGSDRQQGCGLGRVWLPGGKIMKRLLASGIAALALVGPVGAFAAPARTYVPPTAVSLEAWGKTTFNKRYASRGETRRISSIRCLKESAVAWFCVGHISGKSSTYDWIVGYDPHTGVSTWQLQP